jgi:PAS domain S-box-containing protein
MAEKIWGPQMKHEPAEEYLQEKPEYNNPENEDVSDVNNAIRVSEISYRRLFETALDGILLVNATTGQIENVNPFFLKMLNYTHEEFLNKKLWEVGPFKDIEQTKDLFVELQRNGYVRYDYLPLKAKGGKLIEVEFVSNSYDVDDVKVIQCNIRDISERKAAEAVELRYHEQLKIALMNTVEVATIISEMRDPYTVGHEKRVGDIAKLIGAELGLDEKRQEGLMISGYLHDIGKVAIPIEILSKPGKVNSIELQLIRTHAQASYDILHKMAWPWPVAEIALQHHERMDGSGYPNGIHGHEILLEAKIIAVADTIEAMSSHRPYRPALGIEKALEEIALGRGTKYDVTVVDACMRIFENKSQPVIFSAWQ